MVNVGAHGDEWVEMETAGGTRTDAGREEARTLVRLNHMRPIISLALWCLVAGFVPLTDWNACGLGTPRPKKGSCISGSRMDGKCGMDSACLRSYIKEAKPPTAVEVWVVSRRQLGFDAALGI